MTLSPAPQHHHRHRPAGRSLAACAALPKLAASAALALAGAAQAQTPAAAPPASQAASQAAAQGGIKRWVDERGVVHYGDALPPSAARAKSAVTEVKPRPALVTDEQSRQQAQARLQAHRDQMAQQASQQQTAQHAAATDATASRGAPADGDQSCRAQWQRYDAAYACLDGSRAQGGIVRPDALKACPSVKQPDCPMPADMAAK